MSKPKVISDEELLNRASKFKRRSLLRKHDNKAYQGLHRRGLLDVACANMEPSATRAYTFEELAEEAKKHASKMAFRKANMGAYDVAYGRGILSIICSHMPENLSLVAGATHPNLKWSFDILQERAKKFNRKIDFFNRDPQAYAAAYVKGWLDQICSHMEESYHDWTDDEIVRVAKLCTSRSELIERFSRAYHSAREKGEEFLDSICSHMKRLGGTSRAEIEILEMIKEYLPEAKKIKSDVFLEGKPHIKKFEIDIYVESLRKGIEYDGKRHHSFEYMRKDSHKRKWPDEDIHNYHELKDKAFLAKGIEILHIKEQDWLKNKDECKRRIKEYLGIEV